MPEQVPELEPEIEIVNLEEIHGAEPESEPEAVEVATESPETIEPIELNEEKPKPIYITRTLGEYEEGIKQSVLEMLPENRRAMWNQILGSVSGISRDEIDAHVLREDFDECDKERYKFYVLNDEKDTFWQVMYPDQIIDPMRCVMKFDEYDGSAEVYI